MLEIQTFGTLLIQKNGEILKFSGSSKAETILVYVAMEGGQQNRNGLAAMFWPESSEKNASASLRVALSALRKYVGEYIEITREIVRFKQGANVYLDAQDFEGKIAKGEVMDALQLYQGDLLAGIYIQDSNEFENWRRWEQERLRILLTDAVQVSISDDLVQKKYKKAQRKASELLQIDPLNEVALQQHMVALALDGKRADALKHYQYSSKVLMEELGLTPSSETETVKDLITDGDMSALSRQILPKNNLPHQQTSFIGRENDSAQILDLLKDEGCRLLTLTGPGGVGKTRLSLHAGRKTLGLFEDGVYFIPLDGVSAPEFLIPTIAKVLGFDFDQYLDPSSDTNNQLIRYLDNRSILIILDGYEHLMDGNQLLSAMLQNTAGLKIIVSSRQKLNIQGEWIHQVSGLPIPDPKGSIEQAGGSSLGLFLERARQANPLGAYSEEEVGAALRICSQVEGFPLGIELAAAWTAVLSCSEIADQLEKGYDFLESPILDISDKHRSLRATFNYSWQMLDKGQQEMLAALSVFRGGFSRQAASRIAGADLTNLSTLLDRSLLQRDTDGRIKMHRMIQHFAEENLRESPARWEDIHGQHSNYYIGFLLERESDLDNENMVSVRGEVRREIENLRKAIDWAVIHWERDAALKVIRAYFAFYLVQGWHKGALAFKRVASLIQSDEKGFLLNDPVYLSCQAHRGWFLTNLGMIEESETISREILQPLQKRGLDREVSLCLHNLGVNAEFRGEYQLSRNLLEEAIEIGKKDVSVAFPSYYLWLGYVYFLFGEYEEGKKSIEISYEIFNERGNTWGASFALSKMGLAADGLGEHAAAVDYYHQAYQKFLETGDLTGQGYSLSRMSIAAYFLEEYQEATSFGEQALELFEDIGHCWGICISLCRAGFAYLGQGDIQEAHKKFIAALNLAMDAQLIPLSLYAISGIASILVHGEDIEEGRKLFNYVKSHPTTPATYIKIASRWFQDDELLVQEKNSGDDLAPLEEIAEQVLEKFSKT